MHGFRNGNGLSVRPVFLRVQRGFTVIELIMVLVLIGLIAVFVAPRLNSKDFEARGFHDETLALLRYAQKSAIAQRRTVCVAFTATETRLSMAPDEGSSSCTVALVGPTESTAIVTARSGITYLATPAGFQFNALGQPSASRTMQVASGGVAIGQTITVEAETGYVHD